MKNVRVKTLVTGMVVASLVWGAGVSTYAKFAMTKTSTNNVISASKFEVAPDGTSFQNAKFNIDKINPIENSKEVPITVNKNNTNVNVKYSLALKVSDTNRGLLDDIENFKSPIQVQLLRKIGNDYKIVVENFMKGEYSLNDLHYDANFKPSQKEEFKIVTKWNTITDENDTAYQGKTMSFDVAFKSEQTDQTPVDPTLPVVTTISNEKTYTQVDREGTFKSIYNTLSYYTDKEGKRVVKLGDINTEYHGITMENVVLTETAKGSKVYKMTSDDDKYGMSNKEYRYSTGLSPTVPIIYFDLDSTHRFYLELSNDRPDHKTFFQWFK